MPKCKDCADDDPGMYMLDALIWEMIVQAKGDTAEIVLCFQCAQTRLQRAITFSDLKFMNRHGELSSLFKTMLIGLAVYIQSDTPEMLEFVRNADSEIFQDLTAV